MIFWSSVGILVTFGLAALDNVRPSSALQIPHQSGNLQSLLLDKCCQVGREKAVENAKFNCKLSAREALVSSTSADNPTSSLNNKNRANLLPLSAETFLDRDQSFSDQCEMVLESCCMAFHRTKNCDSGKQFAKSGTSCMDVELSKEATIATESFNDCCMSCSLGILAARNPTQNETNRGETERCKLISHLASSLSGQLYEQTYTECCQENLPRPSGALIESGVPIDCSRANSCAHRCLTVGTPDPITRRPLEQDRCDCFSGYKLSSDGVSCLDIDECKLNLHTCNKRSEICDNTRGSFKCLARSGQQQQQYHKSLQHHHLFNYHKTNSHHSHSLDQNTAQQQQPSARALVLEGHTNHENNNNNQDAEPIEPPFASLRLRPPSTNRWSS